MAIHINRDNAGDRSTAATIHEDGHATRAQLIAYAQRLATNASQRCNGGVIFYVSQRPCRDRATFTESARFIVSNDCLP